MLVNYHTNFCRGGQFINGFQVIYNARGCVCADLIKNYLAFCRNKIQILHVFGWTFRFGYGLDVKALIGVKAFYFFSSVWIWCICEMALKASFGGLVIDVCLWLFPCSSTKGIL